MLVEECPECGAYETTPDGRDDTFVAFELCARCRHASRNDAFDLGFAEYEDSLRVDREDPNG